MNTYIYADIRISIDLYQFLFSDNYGH